MMRLALIALALLFTATPADAAPVASAIFVALASSGFTVGFSAAAASFITRAVAFAGLSLLSRALRKKPKITQTGLQTSVTTTGGTEPQKFILGQYATEGHLVAPAASHGANNEFLTYVIEVSNLPVSGLSRVIVDGDYSAMGATADPDYGFPLAAQNTAGTDNAWVKFHDGTQIAADPMLVAKYGAHPNRPWSVDHVGKGIAYAIFTFRSDRDVFNQLPSVRMELDGAPLYDPRKDTTAGGTGAHRFADPATWEFTRNPVVMIYAIMRGLRLADGNIYGGGVAEADMPASNWMAAMNACDVPIGARPSFEAGFEVDVSTEPAAVIDELLKSCNGQISEFGGSFRVRVGAPAVPVFSITDDDIAISEAQQLDPFPGLEGTHNAITARYVEPASLWESRDATPLYNAAWEAEDGGRRLPVEMTFPAVANNSQVQQIMAALIADERRFRVHKMVLAPSAAILEPLDAIAWTSARNGYSAKVFEVVDLEDRQDTVMQHVVVRERDAADYSWSPAQDRPPPAPIVGVPGLAHQPIGLNAVASTAIVSEKLINSITLTVTTSNPAAVDSVEVEFKLSSASVWTTLATGQVGPFIAGNLIDAPYDFRARGVNAFGLRSGWVVLLGVQASGTAGPPSDVTGLHAQIHGATMELCWTPVPDADLSFYRVRHSANAQTGSWANATTAADKVARPASSIILPARSGAYHIRAVDKTGQLSTNATTVTVPAADTEQFATTLTQAEAPLFAGTKLGCSVVSNALRITTQTPAPTQATYTMSAVIDTGLIRRVRARIDADVARISSTSLFDDIPGTVDTWTGLWDDLTGAVQFADTDVLFFISTTDDDPAGAPVWGAWRQFRAGEYSGRAFRFQIVLSSTSDNVTPSVTALTAIVEYT